MKRLALSFCLIGFSAVTLFAQTGKGWREVGGMGRLDLNYKNKAYNFDLTPEMYWFTGDHLALGTDFGGGFAALKDSSFSSSNVYFYVAPGLRYFFGTPDKNKWRPYLFGNGGYQFGATHTKFNGTSTNGTNNGFRGYAGTGVAWFFSDHAAFDIRMRIV
ncbi:MAG TPA: outer membrane beta-barrel protein, partial [Bacteroidia bacterium]|nr:outer membrane beta-barrel protein [Bacteroidia bacterium]